MNVCMLALMVMVPSHSVPISGASCATSGYTRAWDGLLHKSSIAKNDTRYGLRQGGPKNGLSAAETEWISRVTGHVICPGGEGLVGAQGSGSLIGRNDLIVTNVHVVRNDDGSKRDDWDKCYFESQSQPPVRRKLKFFDPGTLFGTRLPDKFYNLDYALIRLDEPILGVEPISIAGNAGSIKADQKILLVSAMQADLKKDRKVIPNEPIIQSCSARNIIPPVGKGGVTIHSDCSGTGGASGSIMLERDESNRLVGTGIISATGKRFLDGREYESGIAGTNYSLHLMFDGQFYRDLQHSLGVQSGP